ncbi:MAG TPA: hypothetical protein VH678_32995 [Xanthobacteraceae bacterium]
MTRTIRHVFGTAVFFMMLSTAFSFAQQPQTVRIRGQIEKAEGDLLQIKARNGDEMKVKLVDPARVMALVKASLADIKVGTFVGVTAMPQADGTQKAIAIHIFHESQRGVVPERFGPWDLRPGSTMTNAIVETSVSGVDGQTLTVKYKDGEKKVTVPPETPIVAVTQGSKDELKPGVGAIVMAATKQPDGSLTSPAIYVGRAGVVPPM